MKAMNRILMVKNKINIVGILLVFCCLAGGTSCYADEMKVNGNLIECVRNGYYNVPNIDKKINSNTYVKDVLTEIYGVCNQCHKPGYYGHWYVGVWPTGSSTNAYDPSIVIDKLTNSESVYLWSQVSLCGNSVSDYRSAFDMIINPFGFVDTGYHRGSFPYIDQGSLSGWNSLSKTVSQKYGVEGDEWGVYGDPHAVTFDPIAFSKDRNVIVSRDVKDGIYYLLSYSFRSSFVPPNGECVGCVYTKINWNNFKGVSAFELSVQAKQAALIGIAIDQNGAEISELNSFKGVIDEKVMAEELVPYEPISGASATIRRAEPGAGQRFLGWKKEKNGEIISTDISYSETIKKITTVYAVYQDDDVYGKISLEGATKCIDIDTQTSVEVSSLGYTQADRNTRCVVPGTDCDSIAGCTVRFEHYLKGKGSPSYSITGSLYGQEPILLDSDNKTINNKDGFVVYSDSQTIYPGDVYCETMTFNPHFGETATIKMCASAEGQIQP